MHTDRNRFGGKKNNSPQDSHKKGTHRKTSSSKDSSQKEHSGKNFSEKNYSGKGYPEKGYSGRNYSGKGYSGKSNSEKSYSEREQFRKEAERKTDDRQLQEKPEQHDENSFYSIIKKISGNTNKAATGIQTEVEPLAQLDYNNELEIKNRALAEFWNKRKLPGTPLPVTPSPLPRHYRSITKRKVQRAGGSFYLIFGEEKSVYEDDFFRPSLLEPEEHNTIYRFLIDNINRPSYKVLGNSLNYLIIRGNYKEFSVIFNVHTLNAEIVRRIKAISEQLKTLKVNVISAFIYLDPTRSEYYLENLRPDDRLNFRKLFGPDKIFLKTGGMKYSYHPTSFSQVNESMIPVMTGQAEKLLGEGNENTRLIDLYCGYGLFTLFLASRFREAIGVEAEGESVNSARENAGYHPNKNRVRFIAKRITGEVLEDILPLRSGLDEVFLLDPPRQGTDEGVIKIVAEREPKSVLHIFCGIEQIPGEIKQWNSAGYKVNRVVPLDMFPGTPNLEILILLKPAGQL